MAVRQIKAMLGHWLQEFFVARPELLRLLPDLGKGEREVVAQSLQEQITSVAMDDLDGRRIARRLGLEPIGTAGLLLVAKRQGLLPSVKEALE